MSPPHLDLREVTCFLRLAEELHFGRAAAALNMTQPGLSRTIRELEREVGTPLLERTTRSVRLTEAGQAFLEESRAAMDRLGLAVTRARRVAAGLSGELRIAYMDFAINGRLPELVRLFGERHPEIRLELGYMPTTRQHAALLERRIDVGFGIGGFDHALMAGTPFDEDHFMALLPSTHRLAHTASLTLADLAAEPFVLGSGEDWQAFRERLFALCGARGFVPRIVQQASSSEGIFGLVAAGTGVSLYGSCVRNIHRRGIVLRALDDVPDALPTHAVWRRDSPSPTLRRFTEFLRDVWGGPGLGARGEGR